jgi:hypothetical protein
MPVTPILDNLVLSGSSSPIPTKYSPVVLTLMSATLALALAHSYRFIFRATGGFW